MENKQNSEPKKSKKVKLDFNFSLLNFEREPLKEIGEQAKDKKANELTKEDLVEIKANVYLSGLIGSSNKDFNGKAWIWRVDLYREGKLELDEVDAKMLKNFVEELKKESKISNDMYYVNFAPLFQSIG